MKTTIKLEELLMLAASVYALWYAGSPWYFYLLMFIGPDIGMLGYLVNNSAGMYTYNLLHHKGLAILVFFAGFYTGSWGLLMTGVIIFGHSSMDRFFGYGLKYDKGFTYTHLGRIGKDTKENET